MTLQRAQEIELQIEDYAFGGRGIARIQTEKGPFVVFVDNTFPGQRVLAKIETKRKTFAEAKLLAVIQRAEIETVSDFQEISGGPYIHVPVAVQERYKQESTLSTFARLSGIQNSPEKFDAFIRHRSTTITATKWSTAFLASSTTSRQIVNSMTLLRSDSSAEVLGGK